jgi:hypothetical protein
MHDQLNQILLKKTKSHQICIMIEWEYSRLACTHEPFFLVRTASPFLSALLVGAVQIFFFSLWTYILYYELCYSVHNQCESFIYLNLIVKNMNILIERYFKW